MVVKLTDVHVLLGLEVRMVFFSTTYRLLLASAVVLASENLKWNILLQRMPRVSDVGIIIIPS